MHLVLAVLLFGTLFNAHQSGANSFYDYTDSILQQIENPKIEKADYSKLNK